MSQVTEHLNLVGDPDRTILEHLEEGLGLDPEWAILNFRDDAREVHVTMLLPNREAAEARAANLIKGKSTKRASCVIRTIEEALA